MSVGANCREGREAQQANPVGGINPGSDKLVPSARAKILALTYTSDTSDRDPSSSLPLNSLALANFLGHGGAVALAAT